MSDVVSMISLYISFVEIYILAIFRYNIEFGTYRTFDNMTAEKYASMIFMSFSSVFTSFSFLAVFLFLQPHAYDHFKALMRCQTFEDPTLSIPESQETASSNVDTEETESVSTNKSFTSRPSSLRADASTTAVVSSSTTLRDSQTQKHYSIRDSRIDHHYSVRESVRIHNNGIRKSLKVAVTIERETFSIPRDTIQYSFYDLRTDEELMEWIDDEFAVADDSIFASNFSGSGISMQDMLNPIHQHERPSNISEPTDIEFDYAAASEAVK
jgi:hypothetical protein